MDYVCLATSYSTEQGITPKGIWCGNSTVTHSQFLYKIDPVRTPHMAMHGIVADCPLHGEKEDMLPTKMTLHTLFPPLKTCVLHS